MVPIAGSAYTYGYASPGEIWAWIIGWDLILEYSLAISVVAIGWSGYMDSFLSGVGLTLPAAFSNPPGTEGGLINIPAILIIGLITLLLVTGFKGSARFNSAIVAVKVSIVIFFIFIGIRYINPANWTPFLPFGWTGVVTGAAIVFFAYIGFDAVSTAAEEVRNPGRDLPIGIIGSLIICTILYILVALVLTGIVPYSQLSNPAPVAYALEYVGNSWGGPRSSQLAPSLVSPRSCWCSCTVSHGSFSPCPVMDSSRERFPRFSRCSGPRFALRCSSA